MDEPRPGQTSPPQIHRVSEGGLIRSDQMKPDASFLGRPDPATEITPSTGLNLAHMNHAQTWLVFTLPC